MTCTNWEKEKKKVKNKHIWVQSLNILKLKHTSWVILFIITHVFISLDKRNFYQNAKGEVKEEIL